MEYGTTVVDGQRLRRVVITGSMDYLKSSREARQDDDISREKRRGALREAMAGFADSTTAHALPLIINGTYSPARAAWLLIWLVALGLACLQATLLLSEFFTWPSTTQVELITKTNLDFPAVTICNMNRIRRSSLVGTRFEGLIAIDGGIDGSDYDYSWFFDWSSNWFDEWTSSSSTGSSQDSSANSGTSAGDSTGDSTGVGGGGSQSMSAVNSGSDSVASDSVDSSVQSSAGGDSPTSQSSSDTDNSTDSYGNSIGGMSSLDDGNSFPSGTSSPTTSDSAENWGVSTQKTTEHPQPLESVGTTPASGSSQTSSLDPITVSASHATTVEHLTTAAVTSSDSLQGSTQASPNESASSSVGGASSSSEDVASSTGEGSSSSSKPVARRKRSANSDQRRKRTLSSSSSSSNDWWDSYDFSFYYYDYYDWEGVTDENDWRGFYSRSRADDFSDLVDIANPTREELEALGHQAQDFILQCTFDKRKCNYSDFYVFQNKDYGNCFTFNHGMGNDTIRTTSKSGAKYGLHLTLFIEQPEYMGIFSPESGVRLSVHGQRTMPLPEDDGITAAAGLATSVGVRQDYIERLPHPHGNCSDGANTDFNASSSYDYSLSACTKYCLQSAMLSRCGCVTDILINSAPKCSYLNTTQQTCRQAVEALYEDDILQCKCPTACSETKYKLGVSSSRWPSERYEEHLYSRVSATNSKAANLMQSVEQTRKNLVRLRVYFEELNYQSIIQSEKYTVETLLGSLGGLFGLYIGFSVMTMAEVVLLLVKLLKILCSWGQRRNNVQPTVH